MKKFIALILVGLCGVFSMSVVQAEGEDILVKSGIIEQSWKRGEDIITREDCLFAILRSIGVTDEINKFRISDFYPFGDAFNLYLCCASKAHIAYGEKCIVDTPTYNSSHRNIDWDYFFFPDRAATVKEALAFMLRCLEDLSAEDFDLTLEKAKEYSLISEEDAFVENIDEEITQGDFVLLLERFVQQKRYKYYASDYEKITDVYPKGNVDAERSVSYIEMLEERLAE